MNFWRIIQSGYQQLLEKGIKVKTFTKKKDFVASLTADCCVSRIIKNALDPILLSNALRQSARRIELQFVYWVQKKLQTEYIAQSPSSNILNDPPQITLTRKKYANTSVTKVFLSYELLCKRHYSTFTHEIFFQKKKKRRTMRTVTMVTLFCETI